MSRFVLSFVMAMMIMAMTVASVILPSPYLLMEPGPAMEVGAMISVPDEYRSERGNIYLTSVSIRSATLSQWAVAFLDPTVKILPRDDVQPQDISDEDYRRIQVEMLEESKTVAKLVALDQLGYDVKMSGQGAQVEVILPNSPTKDKLAPGDTIVGLNGKQVDTAIELIDAVKKAKPGDSVTLQVVRSDQKLDIQSATIESTTDPGQAMLGVLITTHMFEYNLPFDVHIDTENLAGPSAGLMFTLGIVDALTPGDLTRGHKIAGTGTIAIDGTVGKIDGVQQKVAGAERAGAEYFLSPADNYDDAMVAGRSNIQVVSVRTVDDALSFLSTLGEQEKDKMPAGAQRPVEWAIAR